MIDDEYSMFRVVEAMMSSLGFNFVYRNPKDDIVKYLKNNKVDIVIVDYFMEPSGKDLIYLIRTLWINIPIILLTCREPCGNEIHNFNKINVLYVSKPIIPHIFSMTIKNAIRNANI
jgi:DNA-binding response OmpR family regulator